MLAFQGAASEERVSAATYHVFQAVGELKRGRRGARETVPVGPVAESTVSETLKHPPPIVAAMVRLKLLDAYALAKSARYARAT